MMRVLGFMTGTSLDAIDMAILETDGLDILAIGPGESRPLALGLRQAIHEATTTARVWKKANLSACDSHKTGNEPEVFQVLDHKIVLAHYEAAKDFLNRQHLGFQDLDLIGFHGQTVLHQAPSQDQIGYTRQLGDGALLAQLSGVPVAFDFRRADVAEGGHGAPLAPIYHWARLKASGFSGPLAILNLGGVANITLISEAGDIAAFDLGPGNGLIDRLVQDLHLGAYDQDGALAAKGRVNQKALQTYLSHPHFLTSGPKSLDRHDFDLDPVKGLSPQDAAATLVALTAEAVAFGLEGLGIAAIIACGGGRHNKTLCAEIGLRARRPVMLAEHIGWRGDLLEAEAFAYLAARTFEGLPISFPETTGAPKPLTGGQIAWPGPVSFHRRDHENLRNSESPDHRIAS